MDILKAAIVDDDNETLDLIAQILEEEGLFPIPFHRAEDLLETIQDKDLDLIICDLKLPGMSGLDLLNTIHELHFDIPFVLITGYASIESAIEAVNRGAFYYIKKPFNIEEIRFVINTVRQKQHLIEEITNLKEELIKMHNSIKEMEEKTLVDTRARPPRNYDMDKILAAIDHLERLQADTRTSNREYGSSKGSILKEII
ncbi:MAG: response regulator [Thermodesulfobacteriota bacterium]|nr:response regulator [Thermodesulfobacteriota bacterium]